MEIVFKSTKMQKICSSERAMKAAFNAAIAERLKQRLSELDAADFLADLTPDKFPQANCHELGQDRKGQLAVDLSAKIRLIFTPAHDPLPNKLGGGLDWTKVTRVLILEVTDYH